MFQNCRNEELTLETTALKGYTVANCKDMAFL
jgi:hypothetical protein